MHLLLVDNHDSFTYNIVNILRKVKNLHYDVHYPEDIQLESIKYFDKFIFSPGPDIPFDSDIMHRILDRYGEQKSILGICLGFQSICMYFGAKLENMEQVVHGKPCIIHPTNPVDNLYRNITMPFRAGLYHSWRVSKHNFPLNLQITSWSGEGQMMSVSHRKFDIKGVQFHPESVLTPEGEKMIFNWLDS